MSSSNAPFFYCPAHQLRFRPESESTILCEQGAHQLGNGFPNQSWWTYCCDCATFWPAEFTKGVSSSKGCWVCDRVTVRRYLCGNCQVVAVESSEVINRKTHSIHENRIKPGCPACKVAGPAPALEHDCPETGLKFLTLRPVCAFCQLRIGASPAASSASVPVVTVQCWSCLTELIAPFKFCKRCGKAQDQAATTSVAKTLATTSTVFEQAASEPAVPSTDLNDDNHSNNDVIFKAASYEPLQPAVAESVSDTELEPCYSVPGQASTVIPRKRRTPWPLALIAVVVCVGILFALYGTRREAPAPPLSQQPSAPSGMVYVPGAEFLMGTDDGDEYERPAHKVTVAPFYMDATEVTCERYEKFVRETGHRVPSQWTNNSYPAGAAKLPVTGIDWYDAVAYTRWANKRLPTEEEWELAARSRDGRRYPWGNNWVPGAANAGGSGAQHLLNVGSFPAGKTPSGLMDLAGNAWEWTNSDLVAYPNGKLPEKPSGEIKVVRGGSWQGTTSEITTTYRGYLLASGGDDYSATGFRCVRDIPAASPSKEN